MARTLHPQNKLERYTASKKTPDTKPKGGTHDPESFWPAFPKDKPCEAATRKMVVEGLGFRVKSLGSEEIPLSLTPYTYYQTGRNPEILEALEPLRLAEEQ